GAITAGNITRASEFNMFVDPHAAYVVLGAGLDIVMITLDVTHNVVVTPKRLMQLREIGNNPATQIANMMEASQHHDLHSFGLEGRAVHDVCVPIYILNPDLFKGKPAHVSVEIHSQEHLGGTI